jgi:hypothetical protein
MRTFRLLLTIGAAALSLSCPCRLIADDTTPPVVVPHDKDDLDLIRDLKGVPDNIKTLILNFDKVRDKYLMEQRLLLVKLRHATTPEEREALREQLQDNRQQFLTELKAFREQLRDDLKAIKNEITAPEFRRIIDAARDAGTDGSLHHHRGH